MPSPASRPTLVLGSKNYSSWSLRPWIAMAVNGADFAEIVIPLQSADTARRIREHSPAGRVPVLKDGAVVIWESLAILEYLAEQHPEWHLWPADRPARAHARTISNEMHAGFRGLREALPMNVRRRYFDFVIGADARPDIDRVLQIWRDARNRYGRPGGGDFLFGRFGAADAMYAPVVTRFLTYGVALDPVTQAYCDAVMALPAMQAWLRDAAAEPAIAAYEK